MDARFAAQSGGRGFVHMAVEPEWSVLSGI
jgi:hypothetical protein